MTAGAASSSPTARATRAGPAVRGGRRAGPRSPRPDAPVRAGLPRADGARPRRGRRDAGRRRLRQRIDVVPLFLGAGGHVRKDLPPLVEALRAAPPRRRASRLHAGDRRARRGDRARWPRAAASHRGCDSRALIRAPGHEPPPVPVRPGGGPPRPEPDRDREGAVHLAARRLQGDPRARGRARRRHLRAPRQAPAPRHRARARGAEVDRGDHARGRQPQAHRRGVLASRTPARCRSPPRTARRATSCPGRSRSCASASRRSTISLHQGTPEQVAQMVLRGGRRLRPGDRVARRLRRARHPALLRMAARARAAGRPSAGAARADHARGPGAAAADLLPPLVHRPQAHRPGLRARAS